MDIQRNLLIVALVLLSGMLLTEWVKFRDTHTEQVAVAEAAAIAAAAPAAPTATAVAPQAMNSRASRPVITPPIPTSGVSGNACATWA